MSVLKVLFIRSARLRKLNSDTSYVGEITPQDNHDNIHEPKPARLMMFSPLGDYVPQQNK